MSARNTAIHFITRAGILLGALFLVGVLLPAIPAHKSQPPQTSGAPEWQSTPSHASTMPGVDMGDERSAEAGAVRDMASGGHEVHSLHMHMTAPRPEAPGDVQRANEIVTQLRSGIEKYRDYHVALDEGFKIFMPEIPQPEYHFTSYKNGFLGAFNFDPLRPTSLLYKKTSGGYELVGAMYTIQKRPTRDQFNARVPPR